MTDKQLTLYAWEGNAAAVVYAVQGENQSRKLQLTLVEKRGGEGSLYGAEVIDKPLDLTGMSAPRLYVEKSDGTKVFTDGEVADAKKGVVTFALTAQQLAVPGVASCQVVLTKASGEVLKVLGMQLDIQRSDLDDAIESEDDFASVIVVLGRATAAAEKAETAAANADTKAQTAQTAANNANAITATVQAKLDNGDFKGEKGDRGTPGGTDELGAFAFSKSTMCSIDSQSCTYVLQGSIAHIECNLTITPNNGAASVMVDGLPFTPKNVFVGSCGKCAADSPVRIYNLIAGMSTLVIASIDGSPLKSAGRSFGLTFVANYEVKDTVTQYGVRFDGGSNPGTRLYNAYGLTAEVGTDSSRATNHFDTVYPWSARRRCCGQFDDKGDFIVNAYEGDAEYKTDGSNGEVWVEHSLFFYKHTYEEDSEEIVISATQLDGFQPAPIFVRADGTLKQKAYTAAYPMALVDGKATSRSGVMPNTYSLDKAVTAARTLGANYTTTTTAEWYTECLCMWVEFATRNLQSVMYGAATLPYSSADTAKVAETGVTRIIVANAVADQFVVGQTIGIGTLLGGDQIASKRKVTAIEAYDADNKAIYFDGNPVTIAVGNIVWTAAYINGSCDSVLSSSGSPVNNKSGKYNCVYRGKETPYGNVFELISDVLFKREGAGTAEDPYSYDIYHLPDPTKYSAGVLTGDYIKLNYNLPPTNGYVKKLGLDSRYPHLRLPATVGASTTTYHSDYYNRPTYAETVACVGGAYNNGVSTGPCCWYCCYPSTTGSNVFNARLSYHN